MNYREISASEELGNFVKYFWMYKHEGEDKEFTILPDGCFDLVVDFENQLLKNVFLTGIWTQPQIVTVTRGTTLLAIRFKIIAAEYLFGRELKSLLNTMTLLSKKQWNIHLVNCQDFEGFSKLLSEQMQTVLDRQARLDFRKLNLFELIYSAACHNVAELSERINWSSQRISRYFSKQYGFSPKTLLNIVRCNASFPALVEGKFYPEKEYTDQSHFIKEIRKYTGECPRKLHKNENDRFLQLSALKLK